jgi:hypothetical protein
MSALRPGVRGIFTDGSAPKAKYLESMVEKGALILQKPYSLASLSQMVRAALEQQVPLAGAATLRWIALCGLSGERQGSGVSVIWEFALAAAGAPGALLCRGLGLRCRGWSRTDRGFLSA